MKIAKLLFVYMFVCILLSSCGYNNDWFGATDRAQIRADAAVAVAQAHRDEAIGVAHESASASRAWAGMLPIILLVIVGGVVACIVVNWQGRIHLERTRQMVNLPAIPEHVRLEAVRRNGIPEFDGEYWNIIEPQTRRLLASESKQLATKGR